MKLLIVATEYGSGMLPFIVSVVNSLNDSGEIDVYGVFAAKDNRFYKENLNSDIYNKSVFIEYPQSSIKNMFYKFYPVEIIKSISRIIKEEKIELVHYLSIEYSLALYDFFFPRKKIKIFYTVHDLMPHEHEYTTLKSEFIRKYINRCIRFHICQKTNLTTSSRCQYDTLKKMYPKKNIELTPFPTLINNSIASGEDEVPELKDINDYILFFGNVDKYKGVDILYDAFLKSGIKNKLVVAGKGLDYFETDKVMSVYRINRFIKDTEVKSLFSKASVVVYPYRSVTMSGVLSIAYFFNKKLIVSDHQFFKDNTDVDALFFQSGNTEALPKKLREINYNEKTETSFYEDNYKKEVLVQKYLTFYTV